MHKESKNIPNNVKKSYQVLGKRYKIEYHCTQDAGECDPDKRKISINKDQKKLEFFKTLLHELLHGLFHELKLDLDDKYEEMLVGHLEEHIIDKWFKDRFKD